MSNEQVLNYLKDRLFDEIRDRLIENINISKKLHEFVKTIRAIIINMKEFKVRRIFRNITNTQSRDEEVFVNNQTKSTLSSEKLVNSSASSSKSSVFRSASIFVAFEFSAVSDTHSNFMNLSFSKKKRSLIQKEKNYRRVNDLCLYCEESNHFVKDHDDSQLLIFKKNAYNLRLTAMSLVSYYRDNDYDSLVDLLTKNEEFSN